ncbi:MAG TPA: hypothetical protein VGG28_31740 [Kofleriaceae bacterium]|jgi:hypothetical protein
MRIAIAAVVVLAACGRIDFGARALPIDAPADSAIDAPPPLTLDQNFPVVMNANSTGSNTVATAPFSTPGPNRLLVAVFVWGTGGTDEQPLSISGGGLEWTQVAYSTFMPGSVPPGTSGDGIWTAYAPDALDNIVVTGMRSSTVETAVMTLGVYSFAGASPLVGANGSHSDQTGDTALEVTVDATAAGSWIIGGFHHGEADMARTPDADTLFDITDDAATAPNGHFQAIGRYRGVTTGPGPITIGSSDLGTYSLTSGVEILAL